MTTLSPGELAQRVPVTTGVLAVYLVLGLLGLGRSEIAERAFVWGAARPDLVAEGEVWRLLTHAFLHGGLLHLFFNSYFLFIVGPALELSIGSARFALLYLIAAVGGAIGGCLWGSPTIYLVGGSGALFGMMGAALAINMRRGRHLLEFLQYGGPRQLVILIVANLVLGAIVPMISNAAHVGGLIAGFTLFFVFLQRGRHPADGLTRVIQAGWIALYLTLLGWCLQPVTRWDHLLQAWRRAPPAEAPDYAQALVESSQRLQRVDSRALDEDEARDIARDARLAEPGG